MMDLRHVIEPVTPMINALTSLFENHPEVKLHQFALAKTPAEMQMAYRSSTDAAAKIFPPGKIFCVWALRNQLLLLTCASLQDPTASLPGRATIDRN